MTGTENIDPRFRGLDTWDDSKILDALVDGQARAVAAVRNALPALALATAAIAARIEPDGRLIYTGAGTSGRQAALDGMELGATFSWPVERIAFVLAEGTTLDPGIKMTDEDDTTAARDAIKDLRITSRDCMIAVAASGTTPFTLTAAEGARAAGALVVAIANNPGAPLFRHADHAILLDTGAEVISGSTRMSAGTAQKAALGLISTLLMTRLGHVHDGLMVSMRVDCSKLERRAASIVATVAGCSPEKAGVALAACGERIKPAILVARGAEPSEAERLLSQTHQNLRAALGLLDRPSHSV
jgi:N-acetylmuramic acid 6-phosphate etherase